jgi:hypothetical protein
VKIILAMNHETPPGTRRERGKKEGKGRDRGKK